MSAQAARTATHTPGPWINGPYGQVWIGLRLDPDGKWRDDGEPQIVASPGALLPAGEARANARLIAAAPDLLLAAKEAAVVIAAAAKAAGADPMQGTCLPRLMAAIHKATQEPA